MQELIVDRSVVDSLYRGETDFFQSLLTELEPVVVKDITGSSSALITKFNGKIVIVKPGHMTGVMPRNKEQVFLSWYLQQDIPLIVATGSAGTGKTLCTVASAWNQVIDGKKYKRIILTKPMDTVGPIGMGYLPGDVKEKFDPYGASFILQFQEILGDYGKTQIELLFEKGIIEYIPIQLMRGMSFKNTFVIADEIQSLTRHELLTICTRMGQNSKLVLLGDQRQRDRKIDLEDTGLYQLLNHNLITQSPLVATIEMMKNERSPLVDLITNVLQE